MAVLTDARRHFRQGGDDAVRRLAYLVFEHMHLLSLRFHLERKTGGLTRVLERGRNAIETIVRMASCSSSRLRSSSRHRRRAALPVRRRYVTTSPSRLPATWCSRISRPSGASSAAAMNDSDTDANVKAIDLLLNYDGEICRRGAGSYDRAMSATRRRASRPTPRLPCSTPASHHLHHRARRHGDVPTASRTAPTPLAIS